MAQTLQEIETQVRVDYPFPQQVFVDTENVDMTQEQYDAWVTSAATTLRDQQLASEVEATESTIRSQAAAAMAKLDANYTALSGAGSLTAAQQRAMLADVTRATYNLIRILRRSKIIDV